jgi:putative transposase
MSRLPRYYVPALPQHVIQRGNNRDPMFRCAADFAFYLDCLGHAARKHALAIHAYVLMTNHVHVLATPGHESSLPRTMQSVGRVYVRYFNTAYQRTGTLWEGRYKATVIQDDQYLLTCMRYIELNPVRAGIVRAPGEYRWSSHHLNAWGEPDPTIAEHPLYRELGSSPDARQGAYRSLFESELADDDLLHLRDATHNGWALGGEDFQTRVTQFGRRSKRLPRGRGVKVSTKMESDPI